MSATSAESQSDGKLRVVGGKDCDADDLDVVVAVEADVSQAELQKQKRRSAMRCALCKRGSVHPSEEVETILGIEVIVHGLQCDACEEMTIDADEARRIDREVATRIARRGIRSGVELKLVRKAAGYRAAELATLLGVTSKTVSRWERGEVEIPRSAAYVVGDLLEQPRRSRQRLEALG